METDRERQLLQACETGNLPDFKRLSIEMDFNAHRDHGIGASCLRRAASMGCQGIVKHILGINPSLATRKDENGFSAMHFAARDGRIEVIRELLEKDILLSLLRDNDGRTPLQLAVVSHRGAAVREFLPGSALYKELQFIITGLINMADNDGNTILHHAATENFLEILGTLVIMEGMDVNALNKQEMTALDILEQQPPSTLERKQIIQQLKDKEGANPTSVTPAHQALMVVAALVCTITFQAGLNPPGGFWPDSNGTNQADHKPGKAIQNTTNPWVLTAFTAFDAMAFTAALALIPCIFMLPKKLLTYVTPLAVVALGCMQLTFLVGLAMVSDGERYGAIEIGACFLPLVLMTMWTAWRGLSENGK